MIKWKFEIFCFIFIISIFKIVYLFYKINVNSELEKYWNVENSKIKIDYLVTGGAGFIGQHMVNFLLKTTPPGTVIKVIDNLQRGLKSNVPSGVQLIIADLRNEKKISKYFANTHTVIHLADIVAGIDYVFSNQNTVFRDNMLININVLKSSLIGGVKRYLYVGTACSFPKNLQYSYDVTSLHENQTYPANPESSYGWSKLMGEYEALLMMGKSQMQIGINRLHNVYGPGMVYGYGAQIIPSIIRKGIESMNNNSRIVVWGSGSQYRDFIFVDDVVEGIWYTLERGMNKGVIQLGTGRGISVRQVAVDIQSIIKKIFNVKIYIQWDSSMLEGDKGRVANLERATEILGWSAKKNWHNGLYETFLSVWENMKHNNFNSPNLFPTNYKNLVFNNVRIDRIFPKTLVILIGQQRGGIMAWKSLKKYVLDKIDADLAVMFTTQELHEILQSTAKFVWRLPEYSDWGFFFDELKCGNAWRKLCKFGIAIGGINNCADGSGGILLAFRMAVYQKLIENNMHIANMYDNFILTRADHIYSCDHPNIIDTNSIYVPTGVDFGGICDRHFVGSRNLFLKSIDNKKIFCDAENWEKLFTKNTVSNLETLLDTFFSNESISVQHFPRIMFTVRADEDTTKTWSEGVKHEVLTNQYNLKVKYYDEMTASTSNCNASVEEIMKKLI